MEYWVSGCICLVFAALSEYAFILFKMVRIKRKRRRARYEHITYSRTPKIYYYIFSSLAQGSEGEVPRLRGVR